MLPAEENPFAVVLLDELTDENDPDRATEPLCEKRSFLWIDDTASSGIGVNL